MYNIHACSWGDPFSGVDSTVYEYQWLSVFWSCLNLNSKVTLISSDFKEHYFLVKQRNGVSSFFLEQLIINYAIPQMFAQYLILIIPKLLPDCEVDMTTEILLGNMQTISVHNIYHGDKCNCHIHLNSKQLSSLIRLSKGEYPSSFLIPGSGFSKLRENLKQNGKKMR